MATTIINKSKNKAYLCTPAIMTSQEAELGFEAPVAKSILPSKYGMFELFGFRMSGRQHVALVMGKVRGQAGILTRLHSSCMTGDVFESLRCDCGPQFQLAMEMIAKEKSGIMLYMDQEGRGIGIYNKINAYCLQDLGLDTVEANLHLGFGVDERDFSHAAAMLHWLGPKSVRLMTNNPDKASTLRDYGIKVDCVVPLRIQPNKFNKRYLATKKQKLNHRL